MIPEKIVYDLFSDWRAAKDSSASHLVYMLNANHQREL